MQNRMNFQQLADHAEKILLGLNDGSILSVDAKEQINCVGKINNLYKAKLDYNINRHKMQSIDFFEDDLSN
jgi:hypothetical protein